MTLLSNTVLEVIMPPDVDKRTSILAHSFRAPIQMRYITCISLGMSILCTFHQTTWMTQEGLISACGVISASKHSEQPYMIANCFVELGEFFRVFIECGYLVCE